MRFRLALAVFALVALASSAATAQSPGQIPDACQRPEITSPAMLTALINRHNSSIAGVAPTQMQVVAVESSPPAWQQQTQSLPSIACHLRLTLSGGGSATGTATFYYYPGSNGLTLTGWLPDQPANTTVGTESAPNNSPVVNGIEYVRCGASKDAVVPAALCQKIQDAVAQGGTDDRGIVIAANAYIALQAGMAPCALSAPKSVCGQLRNNGCLSRLAWFGGSTLFEAQNQPEAFDRGVRLWADERLFGPYYGDADDTYRGISVIALALVKGIVTLPQLQGSCTARFFHGL